MALTDESGNSMVMPVAPMGGYGNNGFGFGGDWAWILLLLLLGGNGWGGFGFGGMGAVGMADGFGLYPWLNNSQNINDGFREQMLNSNVNSIKDSINGIGSQLCNGFAGVNSGIANGFSSAEIAANGRQMANMNQNFGMQTAMMQGFNDIGSQFANCCCENRLGIADLKYTVATENCADRTAAAQNTRDIIDAQTRGTQAVLDKLCQLELDGVKSELSSANNTIDQLRTQLVLSQEQASQVAQTSQIVNDVYNRLASCPVGTTPVYGNQPIFTCGSGCGCAA